jgi:hypothetical protein
MKKFKKLFLNQNLTFPVGHWFHELHTKPPNEPGDLLFAELQLAEREDLLDHHRVPPRLVAGPLHLRHRLRRQRRCDRRSEFNSKLNL